MRRGRPGTLRRGRGPSERRTTPASVCGAAATGGAEAVGCAAHRPLYAAAGTAPHRSAPGAAHGPAPASAPQGRERRPAGPGGLLGQPGLPAVRCWTPTNHGTRLKIVRACFRYCGP